MSSVADRLGLGPTRDVVEHDDGSVTITVSAPRFMHATAKTVKLTADQYARYKLWREGAYIQEALHDLQPFEREHLMSGLDASEM